MCFDISIFFNLLNCFPDTHYYLEVKQPQSVNLVKVSSRLNSVIKQPNKSFVSFMLSIHCGSLRPCIKSIIIIYTLGGKLLQYRFFMGS